MKTAYKLKKITKAVAKEQQAYTNSRMILIKKLADKDEAGELVVSEQGGAQFTKDNYNKFLDGLNKLYNTEIDVGSIHIDELDLSDQFTAQDFIYLDGIIEG